MNQGGVGNLVARHQQIFRAMKKLIFSSILGLGVLVVIGVQTTIGQQQNYQNFNQNQQQGFQQNPGQQFNQQPQQQNSGMLDGEEMAMGEVKEEDEFVDESMVPDTLIGVPSQSKIHFVEDFIIPVNESSVLIGKDKQGGYVTECHLHMTSYKSGYRKIPAGTEFNILDTKQEYGLRVDMLLDSTNLRAVSCNTYKPLKDPSNLYSEEDFKYTELLQAIDVMNGKVEIKLNDEPELITE